MSPRDKEILDRCFQKCKKSNKAKRQEEQVKKVIKDKATIKAENAKVEVRGALNGENAPEVPQNAEKGHPTRNSLMLLAKEKGIKNFRILNKEELKQVLDPGIPPEAVKAIIDVALARWKSGWGSKKKEVL